MAINIPIISSLDPKGFERTKREFKQLEGVSAKSAYAIKKAAIPAAAALGAIAAGAVSAAKAALADADAQQRLAGQLQRSVKATDAQIAANEEWIATQGKLLGYTDDELRPSIASLSRVTGSLTKAQQAATLAMDISAAKGVELGTVTKALEKAYGGNYKAIGLIAPELRTMIKEGASLKEIMTQLGNTFGGAAAEQANTAQGKFKRLAISLDETKESIGEGLLPIVEAALPMLQKFADWAAANPETFKIVAAAIAAVAVAIMAVNTAMALNPFSAIAAGVALLVVGLTVAYKKFEGFRKVVNTVANFVLGYFETIINGWIMVINGIIKGYNKIPGLGDIGLLESVTLPRIRSGGPGFDTEGMSGSRIVAMAAGGIVTAPQMALIGEAGPEAVIPLDRMSEFAPRGGVNIHITTGVGDPVAIGREVSKVLSQYDRRNGGR